MKILLILLVLSVTIQSAIAEDPSDVSRVVCGQDFVTVPIVNAADIGLRSAEFLTIPKDDIWWVALPNSATLWRSDKFFALAQVEIRVGRLGTVKTPDIAVRKLVDCLD